MYVVENSQVSNFGDDNTIYASDDSIENSFRSFKGDTNNALEWFKYNQMAAAQDKFKLSFWAFSRSMFAFHYLNIPNY